MAPFPGRSAARRRSRHCGALQTRDRPKLRRLCGPGSAVHRADAHQLAVQGECGALHRVRDTGSCAMTEPIQIRMGGYGPAATGFSRALKFIGDRLSAAFGPDVDIKYVWNVMDFGYRAEDILWLVESGVLTLGYQSSSYLTDRIPELGMVDLPFLFADRDTARAAMDGALGAFLAARIEERTNFRILGWFENGFRHISNRLREVRTPSDLAGMRIRVLPSDVQARTFALLGAEPLRLDLTEAIARIKDATIDAQENPLANTVTYGVHKFHPFHTLTNHFYISRPVFLNRAAFDAWPADLQQAMR